MIIFTLPIFGSICCYFALREKTIPYFPIEFSWVVHKGTAYWIAQTLAPLYFSFLCLMYSDIPYYKHLFLTIGIMITLAGAEVTTLKGHFIGVWIILCTMLTNREKFDLKDLIQPFLIILVYLMRTFSKLMAVLLLETNIPVTCFFRAQTRLIIREKVSNELFNLTPMCIFVFKVCAVVQWLMFLAVFALYETDCGG